MLLSLHVLARNCCGCQLFHALRSTMKRRLSDKLVLLVKARDPAAAAAAAARGKAAAAAVSDAVWTFPAAVHKAGESIREAAERALKEAIGPSQVRQRHLLLLLMFISRS
jgi:ADP-ribose pyrophosphatase YjhB (NUDIX family)